MYRTNSSTSFSVPIPLAVTDSPSPSRRVTFLAGWGVVLAMLVGPGCDDSAGDGERTNLGQDTVAESDGLGDAAAPPRECDSHEDCGAPTPMCDLEAGVCVEDKRDCLSPEITSTMTGTLALGRRAHLTASVPPSTGKRIARWEWSVRLPDATPNMPAPTSALEEFVFRIDRNGEYEVTLQVWDEAGVPSCDLARYTLTVVPDETIWIELTWHTPNDAIETDGGGGFFGQGIGTNLDLHLLHASARGLWFHPSYDCHASNATPDWNGTRPPDGPRLTHDDYDGAGPEAIYYHFPEFHTTYHVGVHYRNDWGFGKSIATLRVYIYGELKEEWSGVELAKDDMWDALTIDWPLKVVTRVTVHGQPSITPGVVHPGSP